MAFQDGVDLSSGSVLTNTIFNKYFGSGGSFDAVETNQVTSAGDLVVGNGSKSLTRLAIGSARQVLQTNSAANNVEWVPSAQSVMTAKADILSSSGSNVLTRTAVGADGTVLTASSAATSGIAWSAAPGAVTAANMEALPFQVQGQYRTLSVSVPVANRIYVSVLTSPRAAITLSEFITGDINTGNNYILSVYSFDNTTLTRRATTGSTSVPSAVDDSTKLPLSFEMVVGQRYAMAISFSSDPDVKISTLHANGTQIKNQFGYNDPGSFVHSSSISWSAVSNSPTIAMAAGMWNNGGLIT